MKADIFRAYDIRGIYPTDINAIDSKKIAKAYTFWLKQQTGKQNLTIAVGRDVRLSGEELMAATVDGFLEMGVNVVDIGLLSTDMLYFAVPNYGFDGGIIVTASHNPGEYNGMKLVKEESRPISIDTGLAEIRDIAMAESFGAPTSVKGTLTKKTILEDYVEKMISFAPKEAIRPLSVLANPNFGAAGAAIEKISKYYNLTLVKLNFEPDGHFPKGQPDPLLVSNRKDMLDAINTNYLDLAVTWDADADRCMFYDEKGNFIPPIYITGLLMKYFLEGKDNETVVVDTRLLWLPEDVAAKYGAKVASNKAGHSFMKDRMRKENAIFGAETSAHYFFRDLWFTDNGMLPFIILLKLVSESGGKISGLIEDFRARFHNTDETNFRVTSVVEVLDKVEKNYSSGMIDKTDGVSITFADWRMNLRGAANEPLIRLNVEAKSQALAEEKLVELTEVIGGTKV